MSGETAGATKCADRQRLLAADDLARQLQFAVTNRRSGREPTRIPLYKTDRRQALEICRAWHKAATVARTGKLSVDAAREVIARGVSDVFIAANVEALESHSIQAWCEAWTEQKAIETAPSSHVRSSSHHRALPGIPRSQSEA